MDGGSTGSASAKAGLFFGHGLIRTVECTGKRLHPYEIKKGGANAAEKSYEKEKTTHGKQQQEHDPHPAEGL